MQIIFILLVNMLTCFKISQAIWKSRTHNLAVLIVFILWGLLLLWIYYVYLLNWLLLLSSPKVWRNTPKIPPPLKPTQSLLSRTILLRLSKLLYYSVIHALIVIHHSKSIRYLNICMNLIHIKRLRLNSPFSQYSSPLWLNGWLIC